MTPQSSPRVTPRLVIGVAIFFAGIAFTLDNLGVLEADQFVDFWPLIFVAVGLAKLASASRSVGGGAGGPSIGGWVTGGIWILAGLWWTLFNLAIVDIHPVDFWPVFLIIAGLFLVRRALRPAGVRGEPSLDRLSGFAVLGGSHRRSASPDFKGGDFTAVMGGCEVDLRDARIATGPAVIDVFAFWGGVEMRVPSDWTVDCQVTAILGGVDDKTGRGRPRDDSKRDDSKWDWRRRAGESSIDDTGAADVEVDHRQRLIVRGLAMMGGVEIRN